MSVEDPRRNATDNLRGRPSLTPVSLLIVLLIFYLIIQVQIIVRALCFAIPFDRRSAYLCSNLNRVAGLVRRAF